MSSKVSFLFALPLVFACGSAPTEEAGDENAGALQQQNGGASTTGDVEVTVKASDSADAKKFITSFVSDGFEKIIDIDRRDDMPGMSTRDEIENDILRTRRNDGTIECNKLDECTFKMKRVSIVDGNAVSKGDRNYWAGQIFSIFVSYSGGDIDNPGTRNSSLVIGKKGVVPNIECKRAGTERGLESDQCTFNLKK